MEKEKSKSISFSHIKPLIRNDKDSRADRKIVNVYQRVETII